MATCTRKGEMVADVADVDRTTGQRRHQPARCYFTLGQTSGLQGHPHSSARHCDREEAAAGCGAASAITAMHNRRPANSRMMDLRSACLDLTNDVASYRPVTKTPT